MNTKIKKVHSLYVILLLIFLFSGCPQPGNPSPGTTLPPLIDFPPSEASNVTALSGDGIVDLTWTDPVESDFDHIILSCTPEAGNLAVPVNISNGTESFRAETLTNDTAYTFLIKTVDTNGNISNGFSVICTPAVVLPFSGGAGTISEPFIIADSDDLQELSSKVNGGSSFAGKYFSMTGDIDLAGITWIPIGETLHPFSGVYNGNGHTLSHLVIDNAGINNCGFFGVTENAEIRNLTITGGSLAAGSNAGYFAGQAAHTSFVSCRNESDLTGSHSSQGGICGYALSSSFDNCHNTGNIINARDYTGGICGKSSYVFDSNVTNQFVNSSTFTQCTNNGNITCCEDNVGGICGGGPSIIDSCENTGKLSASASASDTPRYIGGICGSGFQVLNCENRGELENCSNSGGIAGLISGLDHDGQITDCINRADLTMISHAAGIAFTSDNISNCINYGNISGSTSMAGIIVTASLVHDCENYGDVLSSSYTAGGISAYVNSTSGIISKCVNGGNVSSSYNTGGICGSSMGTIQNCINVGRVNATATESGNKSAGGICGIGDASTIRNCLNSGIVDGRYSGGIVGDNKNTYGNDMTLISNINIGRVYARGISLDCDTAEMTSCYYDKQMSGASTASWVMTDSAGHGEGLLTSEMLGISLQGVLGTDDWAYATGMYPRPKGVDTTNVALVAATPAQLNGADTVKSVTGNITLESANSVIWQSSDSSILSLSGLIATPGSTGTAILSVSLSETVKDIELAIQ